MKKKSLTIIIPAYNVSQYIETCFDSLLENKKILDSLEIIAINDGSKDDTLIKMRAYENQYPESIIVVDKENGGHGSGINKGIELATGLYLKVLDSDDWVDNQGLTELVETIEGFCEYPDIIINPYNYVWQRDGQRKLCDYPKLKVNTFLTLQQMNQWRYSFSIHSLTVKTNIYKNNIIPKIDEKISYDDIEYILYPVPFIHSVYYIDTVIYQYRYGTEEQSVSMHNYIKRRSQHKQVIDSLIRYYNDQSEVFSSEQKLYYSNRLAGMINHHVNLLCLLDNKKEGKREMRQFINDCKGFDLSCVPNKKLQLLLKTNCFGFSIASWFYSRKNR